MTSSLPTLTAADTAKKRVASLLRDRIKGGALRRGEALPSERRLSEQFGVGRTVVRQALAELDGEGLLERSGPRLRTVVFERDDLNPTWLKRSVAILTPRNLTGGRPSTRSRWLQYTTLGTIDQLRERDIHAITLSLGGIAAEELQMLSKAKPMGLLVPDLSDGERELLDIAAMFRDVGVPVVCYGGAASLADFDRVSSDHETGSYDLARAVLAKGCKSIVRFWPKPWDTYWYDARTRGFARALGEANVELKPIAEFPYTPAPIDDREKFEYTVRQVAGFLLEPLRTHKPDALLMATDRDVPYAAAALRLHGIEPGRDVLLAGYDDYWQHCEELEFESTPPAFTVDKCNQRAGAEMVQLLFDRIERKLPAERQARWVAQRLVEV